MKKILVTDPCYLISDEAWSIMCHNCFKEGDEAVGLAKFKRQVQSYLRLLSLDDKALVEDTGIGDWTNMIDGQEFGADSGMVCVVEDTAELRKNVPEPLAASVEVSDNVKYELDVSDPDWTIVRIRDKGRVIESLPKDIEE